MKVSASSTVLASVMVWFVKLFSIRRAKEEFFRIPANSDLERDNLILFDPFNPSFSSSSKRSYFSIFLELIWNLKVCLKITVEIGYNLNSAFSLSNYIQIFSISRPLLSDLFSDFSI